MRTRVLIGAVGVGFGLWGLLLMRDFEIAQLVSIATWFIGGIVVHDFVLAPLVVGLGVATARLLPGHARTVAAIAFLLWGTLTVAVANVLIGQGGKPDNASILDRPYVPSWAVLTVVLAAAAGTTILVRRRLR